MSEDRAAEGSSRSLSRVRLFVIPWTAARQAPLSSTVSWSLLKLISTEGTRVLDNLTPLHSSKRE